MGEENQEIPPLATQVEVVSPANLNLKGEEVEGSDSDVAACPTTTNSLNPTNPTTNAGQNSRKTSPRPTETNAAEMPPRQGMGAEMLAHPMLPLAIPSASWLPHPLPQPSHRRVAHVSPALLQEQRGRG
jgi:hypothetical protein